MRNIHPLPPGLLEAVKNLVSGDIHADRVGRLLFSTDASIYQLTPLMAVEPANAAEVSAIVRLAAELGLSVHPRGAATGLAGESLGPGLVLDMQRNFRSILEFDAQRKSVLVEPGLTLLELNTFLKPHGLIFGPDPSSGNRATIGGIIANNSTGAHSLLYGYVGNHVEELRLILSDGEEVTVTADGISGNGAAAESIRRELPVIIGKYRAHFNEYPAMERNRAGYNLRGISDEKGRLNLLPLICGSEGTLGLITAARLKLVNIPAHTHLLRIVFSDMQAACEAVAELMRHKPSALEILDGHVIGMARAHGMPAALEMPDDCAAVLYIEWTGEAEATQVAAEEAMAAISNSALEICKARDENEKAQLWRLRKEAEALILNHPGARRAISFVEDSAVPFASLRRWFEVQEAVFARHGYGWVTFGHAGSGVLHTKVFVDLYDAREVSGLEELARDFYAELIKLGGAISAEHADGFSRSPYLHMQYPHLCAAFEEVKRLFDPQGVLNPGRKVFMPSKHIVHENTRLAGLSTESTQEAHLAHRQGLLREAAACHGCAACRNAFGVQRPCPSFTRSRSELDSPRARGNLVRLITTGQLSQSDMVSDSARRVVSNCLNCKSCLSECPSNVDIPALMLEMKACQAAVCGIEKSRRLPARADLLMKSAAVFAPFINLFVNNSLLRKAAERLVDFDSALPMPEFSSGLKKLSDNSGLSADAPRLLLYPDYALLYQNHAPVAAFCRLMKKAGYRVDIYSGCSMLPALGAGDIERARKLVKKQIGELTELLKNSGAPLICLEPSAALAIRCEWPLLVSGEASEALALQTLEAGEFISKHFSINKHTVKYGESGLLHHSPCHLKALEIGNPFVGILRSAGFENIIEAASGCCGMAGTWGMSRQRSSESVDIGNSVKKEIETHNMPVITECSACAMQIRRMCPKVEVRHPIEMIDEFQVKNGTVVSHGKNY